MNSLLTRGMLPEAAKDFKVHYNNAEVYRKRVKEIIKGKLSVLRSQQSAADYTKPAWSEFQADCNGSIRQLEMMLELLGEDDG